MSTATMTPWGFMKNLFSKLCFGVGVLTLAYLSFAGVRAWVAHPSVAEQPGGLQDKVSALTSASNEMALQRSMQQSGYSAPAAIRPAAPVEAPAPAASPAAEASPAAAAAEASPSPGPGAEGAQNEMDAMAENAGEMPPPPFGIPYGFEPGPVPSDAPSNSSDRGGAGEAANPGAPFASTAMLMNPGSSGASGSAAANTPANRINANDLQILETGLKAVMTPGTLNVAGTLFGSGTGANATPTGTSASTPVSNTRWTWNEGLESEAAFGIEAASVSAITFHLALRIVNASGAVQTAAATSVPLQSEVHSEFRGGHPYRVFSFNLANTVLAGRASEGESATLKSVRVVLSFDVSNPSAPVPGNDSVLIFSRSHAQLAASPWAGAALGAGDPGVLADLATYSMKLQKSP